MSAPTAVPTRTETQSDAPASSMQDLIHRLLVELGEDPLARGARKTPKRVERALKFLTSGYETDIDAVLNGALFNVDYSEMVIVRDIDFYSLCEHHLLPFFGKCHVAYIPERPGDRPQQDPAAGRHLRAAAAAPGADDAADRGDDPREDQRRSASRWCARARTCAWRCAGWRSRTPTPSPAPCSARSARTRGRAWSSWSC